MKDKAEISGYRYDSAGANHSHEYLLPALIAELHALRAKLRYRPAPLFGLGCGNGSVAAALAADGWDVTGVDTFSTGITKAKKAFANLSLFQGSAYDDLAAAHGQFPIVISLEVVEHVCAPREYARTLFDLIEPGGAAIVSTPYHGYFKNVALSVSGKMDAHFTALWDHGHIKFWSIPTLNKLLTVTGFKGIRFLKVGRVPALAKSMIAIARRLLQE
jgi:2-polyprenyl-6-hydroxyphenyl methylase/3-demethylubiquinone-9 3-methyltransferase